MADLTYTIGVNTNQAERNIDKLKRNVSSLGATFGTLRNLVGGLAIGGLITSTVRWADAIQDVSDATGIATSSVMGFQQAVQDAGGSLEGANAGLVRLTSLIGEAKDGSRSAIDAFEKINISLGDLERLSSKDILRLVIKNIGELQSASARLSATRDFFSKGLSTTNLQQVNATIDSFTSSSTQSSQAVKSLADAQGNLEKITYRLKEEVIKLLTPISKFFGTIKTDQKSLDAFVDKIKGAISVLGTLLTVVLAVTAVGRIYRFVAAWKNAASLLSGLLKEPHKAYQRIQGAIKTTSDELQKATKHHKQDLTKQLELLKKVEVAFEQVKKIAAIAGITIASAFGYAVGQKALDEFTAKVYKLVSAFAPFSRVLAGAKKDLEFIAEPPDLESAANLKPLIDEFEPDLSGLDDYIKRTQQWNDAAAELARQRKQEAKELAKIEAEILKQNREAAYLDMRAIIDAEKQRDLAENLALLTREMNTELGLKQLAAQNELIGLYGREYEFKQELLAIDAEREAQIASINERLILMGNEVSQNDLLRAQRDIELAHYVADQRLKIFKDRVAKEQAIEGSALDGVKASLRELAESVTPFNVAQQSTRTLFDGMMSGLEQFATTGKLKFKDFALSLIRDLLLIQLRAQATQMFSGIGGFFTSLFQGRAAGGPVKGNTPYVVGEKGPELFVPKSAGTIVPNNKMNGGQGMGGPVTNNYATYNINAIDSQSVAQFFAQNRKIALGAVTMAQKELPYGAG